MTFGFCLLTSGASALDPIVSLLIKSGVCVWAASSATDYVADTRSASTQCLILDMKGAAGAETLRTLRNNGIGTPALLVTDELITQPEQLDALDVLRRPVDVRILLSWIECICAAHIALEKRERLSSLLVAFKRAQRKPVSHSQTLHQEPFRKAVNA